MADLGVSGEVAWLRRGAHTFLCRNATRAWSHEENGDQWHIMLPPDIAALPEHKRYRTHARQEIRRLATAQLYDVEPVIAAHAANLGALIREGCHDQAVALAGHPAVAAGFGIQPPAKNGFVRWQGGIGHNGMGAAVVACHWGPWGLPANPGWWLAWWSDGFAMATGYAAQAREAGQILSPGMMAEVFGPLWYDTQTLLCATRPADQLAAADPAPDEAEAVVLGLDLLYTTLVTWWLLTHPGAVQLTCQPLPEAEQAADRAAGLRPGPGTSAAEGNR